MPGADLSRVKNYQNTKWFPYDGLGLATRRWWYQVQFGLSWPNSDEVNSKYFTPETFSPKMNKLFWLELELSCRQVPGPGISYIDNHHKKYKINVSKTYLPSLRSGKKRGDKKVSGTRLYWIVFSWKTLARVFHRNMGRLMQWLPLMAEFTQC